MREVRLGWTDSFESRHLRGPFMTNRFIKKESDFQALHMREWTVQNEPNHYNESDFSKLHMREKQFRKNQITRINPTFPRCVWEEESLWWIGSLLMNQTDIEELHMRECLEWTESLEWIRLFNAIWEDRSWRIDSVMNQTLKHYNH